MRLGAPEENTEPEDVEVEEPEEELEAEGDVEADEDSDDEDVQEPPRFKVRVDNEEVEVTLDELLNGYSRTADYTRKTQKLSEERKAFEQDRQTVLQQKQQFAEILPQLAKQIENALGPEPDWEALRRDNPDQAQWLWIQRQQAKEQLQQVRAAEQAERQALMAEQQKQFATWAEEQWRQTKAAIPDFDTKVQDITKIAVEEYGLRPQELQALHDTRFVRILHDAVQLRQSLQKTGQAKAEQSKIRQAKPGSREQVPNRSKKRRAQALKQHTETGSLDSAVRAFMEIQGTR